MTRSWHARSPATARGNEPALLGSLRAPGLKLDFVFSCYLIKHGGDYMIWDAGFGPDRQAAHRAREREVGSNSYAPGVPNPGEPRRSKA